MEPTKETYLYLRRFGYGIEKSFLTAGELATLKRELTFTPLNAMMQQRTRKAGSLYSATSDNESICAFRESTHVLYVPRFFGIKKWGPPHRNDLPPFTVLSPDQMTFQGQLRPYQIPVVTSTIHHLETQGGCLLELYCGWGKTVALLYIIAALKRKTVILVHKEFLLNQIKSQILALLPQARVGLIQGKTIDIDDKDIVLCMIQSLVQKEYPANTFFSFGLTIIDEVHHISSQTFSQALFKIVTSAMLGVSATMTRKDGTTPLIQMFLGNVLHSVQRETAGGQVHVRSIPFHAEHHCDNPAEIASFQETLTNRAGDINLSGMITKLCQFAPRQRFLRNVIESILSLPLSHTKEKQEQQENQICVYCPAHRSHSSSSSSYLMKTRCCDQPLCCVDCAETLFDKARCPQCNSPRVQCRQDFVPPPGGQKSKEEAHIILLAHNLQLLHDLYRMLVRENVCEVSLYVGGMKKEDLERSKSAQVILASYGFASEGLDIPTLNTEILATSKSDVVQIVGRILRGGGTHSCPTIYDVVDVHPCFQRQWAKRKAYYKKQGYNLFSAPSFYWGMSTSTKKNNVIPWTSTFSQKKTSSHGAKKGNTKKEEKEEEKEEKKEEEDDEKEEEEEEEKEEHCLIPFPGQKKQNYKGQEITT